MNQLTSEIVEARHVSNLVANTPTQVSTTPTDCKKGVIVKSAPDNTGVVWVGKQNVATAGKGFGVYPGESQLFPVVNAQEIWISDTVGNQAISLLLL